MSSNKINILFFGTPDYSLETLEALFNKDNVNVAGVITKEDKPKGRGGKISPTSIKIFAMEKNIPYFTPHILRNEQEAFFNFCKTLPKIDLSVVIAYGQILPKEILEFPEHGSVNLHASLLPHLRGAAPIQRAIMNGDTKTGVCLMKMDEGLDTGDVYLSQTVKIDDTTTFGNLYKMLSSLSAKIICDNIEKIINGKLKAKKQSLKNVSYARKILKEEALINWEDSSHKILRLINAMDPLLGAYTIFNNKRLKLFTPKIAPKIAPKTKKRELKVSSDIKNGDIRNGDIVGFRKDYIQFKCKDNLLNIYEVQLEGKRRMKAAEFISGLKS
ncbi:MAG: methionyl-tRNA formyltransferase [Bdellovibrionota bacterium]